MTSRLSPEAQVYLRFLCAIEEGDREFGAIQLIAGLVWPEVWQRVAEPGRPTASPHESLLEEVAGFALAAVDRRSGGAEVGIRVHPLIASTLVASSPPGFQAAVDVEMALMWRRLLAMNTGGDQGGQGREATRSAVHAAESALPYLIRLADWDSALSVIQEAFTRDASPPTVAQLLPTARHLVDVVSDEWKNYVARRIWTRLLQYADPTKGLAEGRRLFADLQAAQRHDLVRVVASDLVNAYLLAGQFADAEEISANLREYSRQSGASLGDRFNAEKSQVLVLVGQGRYEDVLRELDRVLAMADELDAIGDASGEGDLSASREVLWSAGYQSAMGLDRSEQALEYLGKVAESQNRRNVPEHLSARTRFNMYGPLIQLGRLNEAADVLTRCREHFENHGDLPRVGKVLSALATVEHERGHDDVALSLERDALRLKYISSASVTDIAIGHHGYGNYIPNLPHLTFAHHLAAALLFSLSGSGHLKTSFQALTEDLTDHPDAAEAFATPAEMVHEVDQVDGVRLGQLLDSLSPDTSAQQRALDSILATVRARLA